MSRKPEPAVTSAAMTVEVAIPGTDRRYVLRVPTFGEAGDLAARSVAAVAPNDAVFTDALRDALRASSLPDEVKAWHIAAIDAAEEAGDALDALYAAHGTDRAAWGAEARQEIAAAQRDYLAATRRRQRAEWAMRDHAALADLRRHQMEAGRAEQIALVALCTGLAPDAVAALPAADVLALHRRAFDLLRPSAAAEKN